MLYRLPESERVCSGICNINIDKLREFQLKEYNLQKEDKEFKPTPPRFNIENVKARIFDLDFQEEENNIL